MNRSEKWTRVLATYRVKICRVLRELENKVVLILHQSKTKSDSNRPALISDRPYGSFCAWCSRLRNSDSILRFLKLHLFSRTDSLNLTRDAMGSNDATSASVSRTSSGSGKPAAFKKANSVVRSVHSFSRCTNDQLTLCIAQSSTSSSTKGKKPPEEDDEILIAIIETKVVGIMNGKAFNMRKSNFGAVRVKLEC